MKFKTLVCFCAAFIGLIIIQTLEKKDYEAWEYDEDTGELTHRKWTLEERLVLAPKLMGALISDFCKMQVVNQQLYFDLFITHKYGLFGNLDLFTEFYRLGNLIEEHRLELNRVLFDWIISFDDTTTHY